MPAFNCKGVRRVCQIATNDQGDSGARAALADTKVIGVTVSGNVAPVVVASAPPLSSHRECTRAAIDQVLLLPIRTVRR